MLPLRYVYQQLILLFRPQGTMRQATLAVDTEPVISEPGMARRLAAKSIYYALGL